jgi:hypothetical protein
VLRQGARPNRRRTAQPTPEETEAGKEADKRRQGYGANTKKGERKPSDRSRRNKTAPDGGKRGTRT